MPYHVLIPQLKSAAIAVGNGVAILEVGVDNGATTIPLLVHLCRNLHQFRYDCIDILLKEHVKTVLNNIDHPYSGQQFTFHEDNSLNVLPRFTEKYDIVLLDGDHNYYTVSKELSYLADLIKIGGVLIIDDYRSKWGDRDLWYSERESHSPVLDIATIPVETEKHGVRAAVDEFLENNRDKWELQSEPGVEFVILKRITP